MSKPSTPSRRLRAEREFGLLVGAIFALFGGWWLYRGKFHVTAEVFLAGGALLVLLGALAPRALVWPHRLWMGFAEKLGAVMTVVILAIVYYLVVTPIGVGKRLFGWDPLARRAPAGASYWQPYSPRHHDPKHFEKMF